MENKEKTMIVIVPCYNEFKRFPLQSFEKFIRDNSNIGFCFVNDGSSDLTQYFIDNLESRYKKNVCAVSLMVNLGKGEAVRRGVNFVLKNFSTKYICYLDADLSTPLEEVQRVFWLIESRQELLFVFGSRVSVFGSQIKRLSYRHYGGRVIATLIDMALKLSIYDTQCGLKIFSRDLANELFKDPFLSRWLFDVEIFAKMKLLYSLVDLNRLMKEIPINVWTEKGNSKVKFVDVVKIPFILFAIKYKYRIRANERKNNTNHASNIQSVLSSIHSSSNPLQR
nr:glycosyltransferase [uncultured Pedobacter sp.]